jgi:hypothetical protein
MRGQMTLTMTRKTLALTATRIWKALTLILTQRVVAWATAAATVTLGMTAMLRTTTMLRKMTTLKATVI